MTDEARFFELADIVLRARSLPKDERDDFLNAACEGDDELRAAALRLSLIPTAQADVLERFRPFGPSLERPDLEPGTIFGKYRIVKKIADGGMSTVYLGEHTRSRHRVAIKFLNPLGLSFSTHEHEILGELSHDNIARLFDSDITDDGVPYLVMEYVDGEPLAAYCEERSLPLEGRLKLFIAVCHGMQHAHAAPIVHRDIKPGNILVTSEGVPKIVDFGIARSLPPDKDALTHTAHLPLTLAFASPEQVLGKRTGISSDIYSLGVVLCVLLTGRLPYRVRTLGELYTAIPTHEPARPSELVGLPEREAPPGTLHYPYLGPPPPPGDVRRLRRLLAGDLDAIVLKSLRKESEKRYQTVAEFADDIRRYLDKEPVTARKGSRGYRTWKFVRHHYGSILTGLVVFLLLCAFAVALIVQRNAARSEARHAEAVSRFLVDMLAVPEPWTYDGERIPVREVLDRAFIKVTTSPPQSPKERGTLFHSLGTIYLNLGLYTPAETLLTPALKDLEATRGDDHVLIADTLLNLSRLHYYHGRYGESERYATRVLRVASALQPPNTQEADALSLLGHSAFARGDFIGAERRFKEVLRKVTADQERFPAALNNLGGAIHAQGRLSQAAQLYAQSLAIRRRTLGEHHVEVQRVVYNLARLYEDQGKRETAKALYRQFQRHKALGDYDPVVSLLYYNQGSLALNEGRAVEAEAKLQDSFGRRRSVLPNNHPDIARSLAELGRAAHSLKHYSRAEAYYRDSIRILSGAFGPRHPDVFPVGNNLAVLLAQQGRQDEAEKVWHKLILESAGVPIRDIIRSTLRDNFNVLLTHRNPSAGKSGTASYRLLPLGVVSLTEPSWRAASSVPTSLLERPLNDRDAKIVFLDDFEDNRVNTAQWEYGGNSVVERHGQLQLSTTVTDAGGWARTRPIPFNPRRVLTISRRAKIHPANSFFDTAMVVNFIGYPDTRFCVNYANYHYTGYGETVTVGFSLVRRDANTRRYMDRRTNASDLLPPIWDRWFDEKLIYDPTTGETQYFLDGVLRLRYNVGPAPPQASTFTVSLPSWGWYTGHYHYIDSMTIAQ